MRVLPHAGADAGSVDCDGINGCVVTIDSIGSAEGATSALVGAPPNARASTEQFAAVLTRHLNRPRSEIASVRAEIAARRGGGALFTPKSSISTIESATSQPV
jgi:hypothetical protein